MRGTVTLPSENARLEMARFVQTSRFAFSEGDVMVSFTTLAIFIGLTSGLFCCAQK